MGKIAILDYIKINDLLKEKYDCDLAFYTGLEFTNFNIGSVFNSINSSNNRVLILGKFEIKRIEVLGVSEHKSVSGYHSLIFVSTSIKNSDLIDALPLNRDEELTDIIFLTD